MSSGLRRGEIYVSVSPNAAIPAKLKLLRAALVVALDLDDDPDA
jgi:hypothetical protein